MMIYHDILNLGCDMGDSCFFPARVEHAQCKLLGENTIRLGESMSIKLHRFCED